MRQKKTPSPIDRLGTGDARRGVPSKRDNRRAKKTVGPRPKRASGLNPEQPSRSTFEQPFERVETTPGLKARIAYDKEDILREVERALAGELWPMPEHDALMKNPYEIKVPLAKGLQTRVRFLAGVREPEDWITFPEDDDELEIAWEVNLRVKVLLMAGTANLRSDLWESALVMCGELHRRQPTLGSKQLFEYADNFITENTVEMLARVEQRDAREQRNLLAKDESGRKEAITRLVSNAKPELSSEELAKILNDAGYEVKPRTVRRIRTRLGIAPEARAGRPKS